MALRDLIQKTGAWLTTPPGQAAPELKDSIAARAHSAVYAGIEQYPPRKYRELLSAYRKNPIVRRATKLCAEAVASIEPVCTVGDKENHELAQRISAMLKTPNPQQDRFCFIRDLAAFEKLSGNGWVEGVAGLTADYIEQYALRPERMRITPSKTGLVGEYTYDPGTGARAKYWGGDGRSIGPGGRILHIKDFAADDDWYGAGALEAAEGPLALYESAQTLARNLFDNGLLMSGILSYDPQVPTGAAKPSLSPDQRAGLQAILDKFKLGKSRAGTAMIADAALKWVPMSTNLVDLQAEEIRNQAARQIANSFGVPPMLLGIPGDNTYSNFQGANRALWRQTILPLVTRTAKAITAWLAPGEGLELRPDLDAIEALSSEREALWARLEAASFLTANEKRAAAGYGEIDDEALAAKAGFNTSQPRDDHGRWTGDGGAIPVAG